MSPPIHCEIRLRGVVQGVGFRPWAARQARAVELAGAIHNAPWGVRVVLEGRPQSIDQWLDALRTHPPQGSQIDAIEVEEAPCTGARGFSITSIRSLRCAAAIFWIPQSSRIIMSALLN